MSAAKKRKRVCLSIDDKLKVLEEIEKGASYGVLEMKYGIGRSTVKDIKAKSNELKQYKERVHDEGLSTTTKKLKVGEDEQLDQAVYLWFKQQREKGVPVNGPMLRAKAAQLHDMLKPDRQGQFVASSGWQFRFTKRHSIRQLAETGESASSNTRAAESFIPVLKDVIHKEGYSKDQLFNADETGLYFRMLPKKSLACHFEKSVAGRKKAMDRVTLNLCANASGSIKLAVQLIAKSAKPRCLRNIDMTKLPVRYCNQRKAWMTCTLFKEWFHTDFVPFVRAKLNELGQQPKALLLLDNCSAHPEECDMVSDDGLIRTLFLPPNVTALIQPMDQGIIECVKRKYRSHLCEELLISVDEGMEILDFMKKIDMLFVSSTVAKSWASVSSRTITNCWHKLLGDSESDPASETEINEPFEQLNLDAEDMSEWLCIDENLQGHEHLDDAEIVAAVSSQCEQLEESDDDMEPEPETVPHGEALAAFDVCIRWLQQQPEATTIRLQTLQSMRDIAASKRCSTLKQKKIDSFFVR
jgi:hypothetical protein